VVRARLNSDMSVANGFRVGRLAACGIEQHFLGPFTRERGMVG